MKTKEIEKIIQDELSTVSSIVMISGEGDCGTSTLYTGTRSIRALKLRRAEESAHGDRWVRFFAACDDPGLMDNTFCRINLDADNYWDFWPMDEMRIIDTAELSK